MNTHYNKSEKIDGKPSIPPFLNIFSNPPVMLNFRRGSHYDIIISAIFIFLFRLRLFCLLVRLYVRLDKIIPKPEVPFMLFKCLVTVVFLVFLYVCSEQKKVACFYCVSKKKWVLSLCSNKQWNWGQYFLLQTFFLIPRLETIWIEMFDILHLWKDIFIM